MRINQQRHSVFRLGSALIGSNPIGFVSYIVPLVVLSLVRYWLDGTSLCKEDTKEEGTPMKRSLKDTGRGLIKAVGETGWALATNLVASGATLT